MLQVTISHTSKEEFCLEIGLVIMLNLIKMRSRPCNLQTGVIMCVYIHILYAYMISPLCRLNALLSFSLAVTSLSRSLFSCHHSSLTSSSPPVLSQFHSMSTLSWMHLKTSFILSSGPPSTLNYHFYHLK